jgi:hypothetical protein
MRISIIKRRNIKGLICKYRNTVAYLAAGKAISRWLVATELLTQFILGAHRGFLASSGEALSTAVDAETRIDSAERNGLLLRRLLRSAERLSEPAQMCRCARPLRWIICGRRGWTPQIGAGLAWMNYGLPTH